MSSTLTVGTMNHYLVQIGTSFFPFSSVSTQEIGDVLIYPTNQGMVPLKIIRIDYDRLLEITVLVSKPFNNTIEYELYTGALNN